MVVVRPIPTLDAKTYLFYDAVLASEDELLKLGADRNDGAHSSVAARLAGLEPASE
ncbi:hypothetical protein QEG98_23765 [Myxococcus sp. MxC21-1]|nr:hypothetical protein [Myxococcus sp. MxC21-1]WNZ66152.1 hypothetical protein QEG98_23765 [Myxococcus sp. MxC21-1]